MSNVTVSCVVPRITGKSGVFAGFVYFEDADGNDFRLPFTNVEGVIKEFLDGTKVKPEIVEAATKAIAEADFTLAPKEAKN